eukprot:Gb_36487 [translate_table: standard]
MYKRAPDSRWYLNPWVSKEVPWEKALRGAKGERSDEVNKVVVGPSLKQKEVIIEATAPLWIRLQKHARFTNYQEQEEIIKEEDVMEWTWHSQSHKEEVVGATTSFYGAIFRDESR